jgi:cell division protein FtsX
MRRVAGFALFVTIGMASVAGVATASPKEVDALDQFKSDAEIFMDVHASRAQIARVRDEIESDDDVERFAYLDHRTALAEFRRIFRRNHELRDGILARDLPVSFRLVVRRGALDDVGARYEAVAGVDEVLDGRSNETNGWTAREACSRTAYDLEAFMDEGATSEQIAAATSLARQAPTVEGVEVADA